MFLPLRDKNPTTRTPWITFILLGVNILVFLYQLAQGDQAAAFIARWGATPFELTHMRDLVGPVDGIPLVHVTGPFWLPFTAISSMFLHGGVLHLAGNMLFLWIFGNNVEDILGHFRYLLFYLLGGLLGLAMHVGIEPNSVIPTVGASGAISAILGGYWILFPHARVHTLVFLGIFITIMELRAGILIGVWIAFQFLGGLGGLLQTTNGGVAYWAHIGGFVAGWLAIRALVPTGRMQDRWAQRLRESPDSLDKLRL